MKIKLTLVILFSIFLKSKLKSQQEYNFSYKWGLETYGYYPVNQEPVKNIKQIVYVSTDGKKSRKIVENYNEDGKVNERIRYDKNESEKYHYFFSYDVNGYKDTLQFYKKGELKNRITYKMTKKGDPVMIEKKNGKDKILSKNTWKYNNAGCVTESIRFKKQGVKIKKRWEYEYIDSCTKTKSILYNGKGKIINEWTFNCDTEGEKLEKKENQTQVCRWQKNDDSILIKTYQYFDEKGKVIKIVNKFSLSDTLILEHILYNNKDELENKRTYDKDWKKPLTMTSYRNGKVRHETQYEYSRGMVSSVKHFDKKKKTGYTLYKYNDEKLMTEQKRYNKKDEVTWGISLSYVKRK